MTFARLPIDPARFPVLATGAGAALGAGSGPRDVRLRCRAGWMPIHRDR